MTKDYLLALDQGTTSSRALLFTPQGEIVASAQVPFPQHYPKPGWVEHDPMELLDSQLRAAADCVAKSGVCAGQIAAVGLANQRETALLWEKRTGKPVGNAIVWQCRRTAEFCTRLQQEGYAQAIRARTGLLPDAYFSGTKYRWLLNEIPGARARAERGELIGGTVDSWLLWNLTGGKTHRSDYANCCRTMLLDIHRRCWDEDLCRLLEVPRQILPQPVENSGLLGVVASNVPHLEALAGVPICGAAGDQQAALFGQCCFEQGEVKNTYGTGCFLLMNTGHEAITSQSGLLTTIAASTSKNVEYALEGSVFVAGAGIQWLRDSMRMLKTSAQSQEYAEHVPDTAGVYIVPAFAGMGAPYWDQYARGTIVGITRGCTKEHFIRATLESIAYQTADVLEAMEKDSGIDLKSLKVDGGASANDFLMQFQADIVNTQVRRPACIETTALGAAYLAGLAVGYWKNRDEIRENWQIGAAFAPQMEETQRRQLLKGWHRAVKCALAWAEDEV